MDRITTNLVNTFAAEQALTTEDKELIFEKFANYSVLSHEYLDEFDVEDITVAGRDETGLDGITVIANGTLACSDEEIDDLCEMNNSLDAKFIFVQAKTSPHFDAGHMVQRIWRAHGLRPHQVRSFKLSTDPRFAAKVEDIVGLYVDPPAHAVVLSIDEKSQIQALDRTQPGLPLKKGRAGTMTHDYKRYGTTTWFAALNVLEGSVVGRCMQRHRHQEFLRFFNEIERAVPAGKLIHVVLDNYGAHKQAKVRRWRARHPRWIFHFTPTSCSWLNAVETLFAKLAKRQLKRGVFPSVVALQEAIHRFVAAHNRDPKPFVWKADPKAIIAAAKRGYQR